MVPLLSSLVCIQFELFCFILPTVNVGEQFSDKASALRFQYFENVYRLTA